VTGTEGCFAATPLGCVPLVHLAPLEVPEADPVVVSERFLGTPYLWGGNSAAGIDCSGLVQAACLACGIACPGDSDMQAALGVAAEGPPRRGDLLFWKGHVALVRDAETLIHANAHHMAVTVEGIEAATARIAAQGHGPVTAHRRLGMGQGA
jgi:cell wall-associated NlpC family hydrolase